MCSRVLNQHYHKWRLIGTDLVSTCEPGDNDVAASDFKATDKQRAKRHNLVEQLVDGVSREAVHEPPGD